MTCSHNLFSVVIGFLFSVLITLSTFIISQNGFKKINKWLIRDITRVFIEELRHSCVNILIFSTIKINYLQEILSDEF